MICMWLSTNWQLFMELDHPSKLFSSLEAGEGGVHIRSKGKDLTHLLRVEPPEMYKNSL